MTRINFSTRISSKLAKSFILLLSLLLLSNCGNIDKFTDAEFGSYDGYENLITQTLIKSAKNPDSIKIRNITKPRKTLIQNTSPSALWEPYYPAYGICVEYGGNNSYGAFTVSKQNFYMRKGVLAYDSVASHNNGNGYDVTTLSRYRPCLMD